MRKKRESYCSMSKEAFLNPETGHYRRLDNTAWYIKKKDNKACYFLNMQSKFQQMPDACFKITAEKIPSIDFKLIKNEIKQFLEATNG